MTACCRFQCAGAECRVSCHKATKCSGIRRLNVVSNWRCRRHKSADDADISCAWCSKHFRQGTTPLKCSTTGCKRRCHAIRICSGISHYLRDPIWKCEEHGGRPCPKEGSEVRKEKLPCTNCKGPLRGDVLL